MLVHGVNNWYFIVSGKLVQVVFVGEEGSDTGGLTREFFRLIAYNMKSKYLEKTGCFQHNAIAYQVNKKLEYLG